MGAFLWWPWDAFYRCDHVAEEGRCFPASLSSVRQWSLQAGVMVDLAVCANVFGCVSATAFLGPGGIIGTVILVWQIYVGRSLAFNC